MVRRTVEGSGYVPPTAYPSAQPPPQTQPIRDVYGTSGISKEGTAAEEWSRSVYRTWFPTTTPGESAEIVLSELAFRRLWDPGYKARYERQQRKYAELGPEKIGQIQQQRAEQAEVAGIAAAITVPVAVYTVEKIGPSVKEAWRFSTPAKMVQRGKLWVQSKVPFWQVYEPFKRGVAPGEFAIPTFERFGIPEFEAEQVAWESMRTPRMGGVMFAREGVSEGGKDSFSYLFKGIQGWVTREATFTPLISQTVLTRQGIQPWIPSKPSLSTEALTMEEIFAGDWRSRSLLTGVAGLFRIPKRTVTKSTFERATYTPQRIFPRITPRSIPRQKQAYIAIPRVTTIQQPIQKQAQIQSYRTILQMATPSPRPQRLKPLFSYPKWPLGGGESRGGGTGSLFGKWFRKQQRIKTPQQMLETFFGSRQRRKRK